MSFPNAVDEGQGAITEYYESESRTGVSLFGHGIGNGQPVVRVGAGRRFGTA